MSDTECREAFEANTRRLCKEGGYDAEADLRKTPLGHYHEERISAAWYGWREAWLFLRPAAKAPSEGDELSDEQQLGCLAEDLLLCISDHAYNSETPLRTKICFLIRPYLRTTTPAPDGPWEDKQDAHTTAIDAECRSPFCCAEGQIMKIGQRFNLLDTLLKEWQYSYMLAGGVNTNEAARQIEAIYAERDSLVNALLVCREAISAERNTASIVDTVWASDIETLEDHIDDALCGRMDTTPAPDGPEALVSKLEALKYTVVEGHEAAAINKTIQKAITLVKQHFGGKP